MDRNWAAKSAEEKKVVLSTQCWINQNRLYFGICFAYTDGVTGCKSELYIMRWYFESSMCGFQQMENANSELETNLCLGYQMICLSDAYLVGGSIGIELPNLAVDCIYIRRLIQWTRG